MTHSIEKPETIRLHGKILYPFEIIENKNGYNFEYKEIQDIGQDITNISWLSKTEYQLKHDKIVDEHTRQLSAGCPTTLGFKIDCLPSNVSDFEQTLSLLSLTGAESVLVKDYDNEEHTLTIEQYKQMCLELGIHVMTLRHNRWAAINAIKIEE